ncbi:MAG: NUDIX hydrolase [Bacillota bacterium]|jgi:ADP-ribose pyrophosphatase YjhB (NUDIX family)|nr:NUDIX hydrolase [Bacillota bacterium]
MGSGLVQVRVSGVLVENGYILIVKQVLSEAREWSLPGGRLQSGETLEQAMIREMEEETGLRTKVVKLLYVCDKTDVEPSVVHISFLLERTGGAIRLPTNEFDENPILDVRMVPIAELTHYDFSEKFMCTVIERFPGCGSYKGDKRNIGL